MTEVLTPELCVIGAGSAGLTAAAAATAFGLSVVLIEKGEMGGDCLNFGCVPSKALIAAANQVHSVREAAAFGVRASKAEVNFAAVQRHVRSVIAAIQPNDSEERFIGLGVRVIRAAARFQDRRTVVAGGVEIRARRFIIATGSSPAVPPIPGLDTVPYFTNETIFDLKTRPSHLAIIGGGPIGMELAQAYRRLGSHVTVLEAGKVLPKDDPEMTRILVDCIRGEGVRICENAKVISVERRSRGGLTVNLHDGAEVQGSHLLLATGRRPSVDNLGLETAGIRHDETGIRVNRRLRTSNRRVYAIGDVVAGPRFTHWASHEAGLVLRSILFRFGGKPKPDILPWVTFTDPELAHVGLSEEQALRRHRRIRILRWPLAENDRAQAERATEGHVKVIATAKGRVLGAEILGRQAGEMIAVWAVAVANGMSLKALVGTVLPYPTYAEASRRAALSFYTPKLQSPLVKRVIRVLRWFG